MAERIRIKDIAQQLGVSTATVSNVIHGKTQKISKRTVEKVQECLETSGYVPNMAAILLAQNSSKIVCVLLSGNTKYDHQMLKDSFISTLLDGISKELKEYGYFLMLREETDVDQIVKYASMWNMAGLILIGYCAEDFDGLRKKIRIPFLVIDGELEPAERWSNQVLDNYHGGWQMGEYLYQCGHRKVIFLADNDEGCDHDRYQGMADYYKQQGIELAAEQFVKVSVHKEERDQQYEKLIARREMYTAVFCASDTYAIDFMNECLDHGLQVPGDLSIAGFDDIPEAVLVRPRLTTIRQDIMNRAACAVHFLHEMIEGTRNAGQEMLPVTLVTRESVKVIQENNI